LRTIGKVRATNDEIKKIMKILKNENPKYLQHDLQIVPVYENKPTIRFAFFINRRKKMVGDSNFISNFFNGMCISVDFQRWNIIIINLVDNQN